MHDATAELVRGAADAFERSDEVHDQLAKVVGPTVGEFALGERPDALVGVEFRRVGGKVFDTQAAVAPEERPERLSLVSAGVVQQDDARPAQVAQQLAEKGADFQLTDVFQAKMIVESEALASGADGDCRDDRDLVAPVAMAVDRCAPPRRPGLEQVWDQEESGFVDEDEMGAQPCGVFFTCGQVFRFHRLIAASSRSRARRSGFW